MQSTKREVFNVNLDNCDQEPVHIPNKIQSVGFLIGINPKNLQVTWVSDNIDNFIQHNYREVLGHSLHDFISARYIKVIREAASKQNWTRLNPLNLHFNQKEVNDAKYQVVLHLSDHTLLMECVPHDPAQSTDYTAFYRFIHSALNKIRPNDTLSELFNETAEYIKQTTGYHRVMIYKFDEQWNGHVIAEARESHLESFYDLHYPASDIPAPARKLYTLNPIRIIADIESDPSYLIRLNAKQGKFLDLSRSVLRGVSPIHIEYLKNMGVSATMSSSITVKGKLWGLIACHHYSPYYLDYNQRTLVAYMTNAFAHTLSIMEDAERNEIALKYTSKERKLLHQILNSKDVFKGLTQYPTDLLSLNTASGAAICTPNTLKLVGDTPSKEQVKRIVDWLKQNMPSPVFHTKSLVTHFPEASDFAEAASGVLAICISEQVPAYVLWFKPEVISEVTWGENPDKKASLRQQGFRLSPRKSFEKWKQVVKNCATPWKDYEVQNAEDLRDNILELAQSYMTDTLFNGQATNGHASANTETQHWQDIQGHLEDLEKLSAYFMQQGDEQHQDTLKNIQASVQEWQEKLR